MITQDKDEVLLLQKIFYFAKFTLYCDVHQTDIMNHFSVLGKTHILKGKDIPPAVY